MDWKERFNTSELAARIGQVEMMSQIHGTPPYHGQTIQDFIQTEIIEKLIDEIPDNWEFFIPLDEMGKTENSNNFKQQLKAKWLEEKINE